MIKYAKIKLLLAVLMVLSFSACDKKMSEEGMEEACVKARPSIVPSVQIRRSNAIKRHIIDKPCLI